MTQIEQAPDPFDPKDVTQDIQKVSKMLDDLSGDATARAIHDILQDQVMRLVASLQNEISTLAFYMSAHEERISDIEEGDGSQLLPEDAAPILAYLERCVEIFKTLIKNDSENWPGLDEMVKAGEDILGFVEQVTLPEDTEDDSDGPEGLVLQ